MPVAVRAIYEGGKLRPLEPLDLDEHAVVRISVEAAAEDAERMEWLEQSRRTLMSVWDNDADDVYNALLAQ
jgi:predicted DNA-binding antitoxin AbrB/MazE fold protein